MNNIQDELNSMSLQDASEYITQLLIEYNKSLKAKTEDLVKLHNEAQEKYNLHNDGDAAENAPLDEAIKVLKKVTNEQYKLELMKRRLVGIEDAKYQQANLDYQLLEGAYNMLTEEDKSNISDASGITDLSYDSLKKNIKRIARLEDIDGNKTLISFISLCEQFSEILNLPLYNKCGLILMYTTVRLKLKYNGEEKILTYKIYPEGVSILNIGIIARNCKVAEAIINKEIGYKFKIAPANAEYEILDIY